MLPLPVMAPRGVRKQWVRPSCFIAQLLLTHVSPLGHRPRMTVPLFLSEGRSCEIDSVHPWLSWNVNPQTLGIPDVSPPQPHTPGTQERACVIPSIIPALVSLCLLSDVTQEWATICVSYFHTHVENKRRENCPSSWEFLPILFLGDREVRLSSDGVHQSSKPVMIYYFWSRQWAKWQDQSETCIPLPTTDTLNFVPEGNTLLRAGHGRETVLLLGVISKLL